MGSISKPLLPGYLACVPLSCFPNSNTESIARVKKGSFMLKIVLFIFFNDFNMINFMICFFFDFFFLNMMKFMMKFMFFFSFWHFYDF